ncbi:MAG: hydantoinase B/oxoprolinase family protein [bacterium]|nr:hydantoinase B/oxoprolinase family protein [bacterium]MDE0415319.1 hydantoinase B/oxoprolinase family protein [bacterium]
MTDALERIHLQIMWDRLISVVEEQAQTLMRAAFSPIVRESGDISAGIFDLEGRMMVQAVTGTPGHINTMAASVRHLIRHFPPGEARPGDLWMTNDPWIGAGHLNDFVLVKPCFLDGRVVGLNACTSHLADIGGRSFGPDAADVHEEGMFIPPIKLIEGGTINHTLMTLLRANSRVPVQNEGDLYALIACCEVGEERLADMMREFTLTSLAGLSDHIINTSREATRERLRSWPSGTWSNEMMVDGYEFEIRIAASLTIADGALTIDFSGSSPASRYGINCPLTYSQAYTVFGLKCVIAPDIPNNAGALEPFVVLAPEGSIMNATKPAPVVMRHIVGQLLPDAALGCLHRARPGSVPAEGTSVLWDLPLRGGFGIYHSSGQTRFALEMVHNGGTGARPSSDGLDATAFPSGVIGTQVELAESVAPLIVWRRELRPDSGGAGCHRGGHGQIIEIGSSENATLQLAAALDRITYPPRGREGGHDGARGILCLASGRPLNGKGEQDIPPNETLRMETPGGGGYGDPATRDPALIAADLKSGLVTPAAAERDYGYRQGSAST